MYTNDKFIESTRSAINIVTFCVQSRERVEVVWRRPMFPWLLVSVVLSLSVALPDQAAAHAAERGFVMLLPTTYYFVGGGVAVAVTFVVLAALPIHWLARVFAARWRWERPSTSIETVVSCASFALFAALIAAGFTGSRDPLVNPLPIAVWTLLWVGFALASAVFGDLWSFVNPWTGPYRLLRRAGGMADRPPPLQLAAWVGYWPAVAGLFAFVWFELVDIAPNDPARLAKIASAYWIGTLAAMVAFGEERWRQTGEIFTVFFGFIARLAPLWSRRSGQRMVSIGAVPGAQLIDARTLPLSGVLFVLLALSSVSFDGLNKTFWWLSLLGVNPLEFPGRSAVVLANSFGLVAAFGVLSAVFFGAVLAGHALAGGGEGAKECLGRLVFSIMPIALGYHFSHYLTQLLVNGQYALVAANDPFATGADLLGLSTFHVTTSFLSNFESVETIWQLQAAGIVVAHLAAVLVAHGIAFDIYGSARRAALSQIPLAGLMVAYTVFGLWLLATPTGS